MIPILFPSTLGQEPLLTSDNKVLLTSDGRALYVYQANPTIPTNNGLGVMGDTTYCRVIRRLNAPDEMELRYPASGWLADKLQLRSIIMVKVDANKRNQPLRVYRIKKTIDKMLYIYARSLAYDLAGIVSQPFKADNGAQATYSLHTKALTANPFDFTGNMPPDSTPFTLSEPATVWSVMGGREGSIRDVYGGEWDFDGYTVDHLTRVGQDRGVTVRYGVNMRNLEQDAACADCYTGVVAYWHDDETVINTQYIPASGNFEYTKVYPLDLTDKFEKKPSAAQLAAAARTYIANNQIGVPRVGWKIDFVSLADTEEYKNIAPMETVSLGDTVGVYFEALGVNAVSRVTEIGWDPLRERIASVTLGDVRTLSGTLAQQRKTVFSLQSVQNATTAAIHSIRTGPLVNEGNQLVNRTNGG